MSPPDHSLIRKISRLADPLLHVSDDELKRRGLSLKYKASVGASIQALVPPAFALVTESVRRSTGKQLYPVQQLAGIKLARGHVTEMKTGEGKTLTATLPTFVHALFGRGAHVVTVNDYLARRDFEAMGPIYERLGLAVGLIQSTSTSEDRKVAYRKDITYGTAKELGFDFLRDRMRLANATSRIAAATNTVMRDLHYLLVDEADSVLIDEARTPLIIGIVDAEEEKQKQSCFRWAAGLAGQFIETVHFEYDHEKKKVTLNGAGIRLLRSLPQNHATRSVPIRKLYEYIENAVKVHRDFQRDQHYVVAANRISIVDEFTGRIAEGRQWQRGIHQSVEAKEGLEVTPATRQGATLTLQSFVRQYRIFTGMSGTLATSRREFKKVYGKRVVEVPTHRPLSRKQLPTAIFADLASKHRAVIESAIDIAKQGRAVLIGTRSVEMSERLSAAFSFQEISHRVLNANQDADEAEIIAQSGRVGQITVATNMAGRGTDIVLDEKVRIAGGLHVILTELHESKRIDWQLIGRGSRQGDPGTFQIFVSMDDEILLAGLGPQKARSLKERYIAHRVRQSDHSFAIMLPSALVKYFQRAQAIVERRHLVDRMILMKQDKERRQRHFEMGQDPFCDAVQM